MLLLSLVFIAGCQTVNTVERAEPRAEKVIVDDRRINTDETLKQRAAVVQLNEATVGNGLLKIQVELLNRTDARQLVNYRFDWIDNAGMQVDTSLSNWKAVSLAGKESKLISAVAPTPDAVDFRLSLIERKGTW
jgi:uncharacterized protein YcfL